MRNLLLLATLPFLFFACKPSQTNTAQAPTASADVEQALKDGALIVDVRTPAEYASGHYAGAVNIPVEEIGGRMSELGADKNRPIVLYCRSGRRSGIALDLVRKAGYTKALNGINQAAMP